MRTAVRRPGLWRWFPSAVRRSGLPVVTAVALVAALACGGVRPGASTAEDTADATIDTIGRLLSDTTPPPDSAAAAASVAASIPTGVSAAVAAARPGSDRPAPKLSPLADSVAQYLVFDPVVQTWFLAAKRGKRLLVDIGRVDLDLQHDKRRSAAFLQAVRALSPLPVGTPVRVYDAWGSEDDSVVGFSSWNNRIVATLHVSRHLDSLVRHAPLAYAAIERTDTVTAGGGAVGHDSVRQTIPDSARPVDDTAQASSDSARLAADSSRAACERDTLPSALWLRAAAVRDSIDLWLRSLPAPPYERLVNTERSHSSEVKGCFGGANRIAVAVDLRAGANEWIRERAVLIDTLGRVSNLRVADYRFKAHDFLSVLDPNGTDTDGIVARGLTEAEGGIVILVLQPGDRLARWVGGFAWEAE